jgi:hypothetical protein
MAAAFGNEMLLDVQFISTKIHASKQMLKSTVVLCERFYRDSCEILTSFASKQCCAVISSLLLLAPLNDARNNYRTAI